jgi:hypothetical protein
MKVNLLGTAPHEYPPMPGVHNANSDAGKTARLMADIIATAPRISDDCELGPEQPVARW